MPEPLSHKFLLSLDASRDRVYSLALSKESTPAKAEAALQKCVRALFIDFTQNSDLDPVATLEQQLSPAPSPLPPPIPMPADVSARLSAAVQLEAAKSAHSTALQP